MAQQQTSSKSGSSRETISSKDVGTVHVGKDGEVLMDKAMDAGEAPEGWEDEQIGFPPYWNPRMEFIDPTNKRKGTVAGSGNSFLGVVVQRDERDENFHRYVVQATRPIKCQSGPSDDAQEVIVQPGEFFTLSTYASLPLESYFGMEVWVQPIGRRKLKDDEEGNPRDLWQFKLKVSPESKKLLATRREESQRLLLKLQEEFRLSLIKKDAENPLMIENKDDDN